MHGTWTRQTSGNCRFFVIENTIMTTDVLRTSFKMITLFFVATRTVQYFAAFPSNYQMYGKCKRLYGVVITLILQTRRTQMLIHVPLAIIRCSLHITALITVQYRRSF